MTPWYETRKPLDEDGFEHRHPLDVAQNLPPVEAHERQFYEEPQPRLNPLVVASKWFVVGVAVWAIILIGYLRWWA